MLKNVFSRLARGIDTTNPVELTALDVTTATDTKGAHISVDDNLTKNTTPTFTFSGAETNAAVTLLRDTVSNTTFTPVIGATVASVTATMTSAGVHQFAAFQTDLAGNVGATSPNLAVAVDTTPPTVATVQLATSSASNLKVPITTSTTPTIQFKLTDQFFAGFTNTTQLELVEKTSNVVLDNSTTDIANNSAQSKSLTPSSAMSAGQHTVFVRATDAAGNVTNSSDFIFFISQPGAATAGAPGTPVFSETYYLGSTVKAVSVVGASTLVTKSILTATPIGAAGRDDRSQKDGVDQYEVAQPSQRNRSDGSFRGFLNAGNTIYGSLSQSDFLGSTVFAETSRRQMSVVADPTPLPTGATVEGRMAFQVGRNGSLIMTSRGNGQLLDQQRNLSRERIAAGATANEILIDGDSSAVTDANGNVHVFGKNQIGGLVEYRFTRSLGTWSTNSHFMAPATGVLAGEPTAFLDAQGHVGALITRNGTTMNWTAADLTNDIMKGSGDRIPANKVFGAPGAYITPSGDRHVVQINADGEVIEYAFRKAGGHFNTQNINLARGNSFTSLQDLSANVAPTISIPAVPLDVIVGDPAILVASGATVSDPDSLNFATGKLIVRTINAAAGDQLDIRPQTFADGDIIAVAAGGVSFNGVAFGSFVGGTGSTPLVISFTNPTSQNALEALLQSLQFSTPVASSIGVRFVDFELTDNAGAQSDRVAQQVTVDDANPLTNPLIHPLL